MKKRILAIAFCLIMTFTVMGHIGCIPGTEVYAATATMSSNANWEGGSTLTENTTWTMANGAIVTLKEPITIPNGKTLTLNGWGGFARDTGVKGVNTNALFVVQSGGKLVLKGTSKDKPIIIDGKNVVANASLIISSGAVECEYVQIQNGKNRSVHSADHKNAGKPNGTGGGITIASTGSLTMKNSVVTKNTASLNGGGIYSSGPVTIEDSEITYNRAMSTETGDGVVNAGRGGGFYFGGADSIVSLKDVTVSHNAAMYYGGGGQICSNGSLTMSGNTTISNNTAVLHGAGGLHVTGDAKFTMNGGSIAYNTAQTVGGGIHSSYSCVLNLNSGSISNNIANGRGGGVHVNTGGAITLGEGLLINENQTNNQATGSSAVVDATGDNWSNVKAESTHYMNGYGGGVLIDSGTCTVEGATISGNKAAVGGGGIALTMINMGDGGLDDFMVVSFNMTSGTISGNETNGNGAGVYMMSNKAIENLERYYGKEGTEKYEKAIKTITEENRHILNGTYEDVDDMLNGVPEARVSGGNISNNEASNNGGGLYLEENTKFIIDGTGDISQNESTNGAGVYVASGTAEINGGTMTGNIATANGGALYISGNVTMTKGIIGGVSAAEANCAVNGGAMYVTNGNVNIEHGEISGNKALASGDLQNTNNNTGRGGAIYLAGDKNTKLTMESGTMSKNMAENDGGAIFATGGTIYIGLENCKTETEISGSDCEHHVAKGDGRYHPEIKENKAADTGGGIALTDGVVHFYCGKAKQNQALYKGVGKNVFMDGGEFYLYDAADLGVPRDPDLVIVGGKLHNECVNKEYVNLYYYKNNTDMTTQMVGLAEYEEIMNLPDGEYFWDAPPGYVFLGWTAQGAASENQSNEYVRNKEQYVNSGEPVEVIDNKSTGTDQTAINTNRLFDGVTDKGEKGKIMHLYALWAPKTSGITYINGLTGNEISNTATDPDNPETYSFTRESNKLQIQPVKYAGYDLVGWYIYQDSNQNANWNDTQSDYENFKYEPNHTGLDYSTQKTYLKLDSCNSSLELEAGNTNFGDITLVADFEPAFRNLEIIKKYPDGADYSIDENQSFLFSVKGQPYNNDLAYVDMTVTVQGDGSCLISELPAGTYMVTEITDWSWRYNLNEVVAGGKDAAGDQVDEEIINAKQVDKGIEISLDNPDIKYTTDFTNSRERIYWLSGDSYRMNYFKLPIESWTSLLKKLN